MKRVSEKFPQLAASMKNKTLSGPLNVQDCVKQAQDTATHSELDSNYQYDNCN